jgi:flagellar hook-basal body complex protein FliE
MSPLDAISAAGPHASLASAAPVRDSASSEGFAFGELIARGLDQMEAKVDRANDLVRRFATDDSIPVHEVTLALEEARMAVELALQVRTRVLQAYREIMNMQL